MKNRKGITLIALIITIIILLILATVSIRVLINNGIIGKTESAKKQTEVASEKEQIKLAYTSASLNEDLTNNKDFFEKVKEELNWEKANYVIRLSCMNITSETGNEYTLTRDGTVLDEKVAYLDIEDGSIDLYSNGYKQGEKNGGSKPSEELIEHTGDYIITGTTTENVVKVFDAGTYNITIKNLNIDVSAIGYDLCAIIANAGPTDCFVNIILEGENKLKGGGTGAALGFSNATPNVNGVTNGSTLTISGDGKLEAIGGAYAAGIGSGYTGFEASSGDANNIIIDGGNIIAKGGVNGCGIGGGLYQNANNIVINGGNIDVDNSDAIRFAIGATGKLDNLVINGGTIKAIGVSYSGAIGGGPGSGKITINGGKIFAYTPIPHPSTKCHGIGQGCETVEINGGTIVSKSDYCAGIFSTSGNI